MALKDQLDRILIEGNGEVLLHDAYSNLKKFYSENMISSFLSQNKEEYQVINNAIFSEEQKINAVLKRLGHFLKALNIMDEGLILKALGSFCSLLLGTYDFEAKEEFYPLNQSDFEFNNRFKNLFYNFDSEYFSKPQARYKLSSKVFDLLLFKQKKIFYSYTTPESVIELFAALLPDLNHKRIYNPTAGMLKLVTGLSIRYDNNCSIKASEFDPDIYNYGKMFAEINQLNINYSLADSADEIINEPIDGYDLVIGNLPFGHKERYLDNHYRRYKELSLHIVSESIRKINKTGKALFLINESVLYSGTNESKTFRRELIDSRTLKSIVLLPANLLLNSGIKTCLVLFDKSNINQFVGVVDASQKNYFDKKPDRTISLDTQLIINELYHLDEKHSIDTDRNQLSEAKEPIQKYGGKKNPLHIPYVEIQKNNYDLSIGRYQFVENDFGDEYLSFKNILKPATLSRVEEKGVFPYVRITELNTDILKEEDLTGYNNTRQTGKYLNQESFLIGTISGSFKPSYFDGSFPIELSSNVNSYYFDSEKVFYPYLLQELNADYVLEQMEARVVGSVIRHISRSNLNAIKIKLPALAEQKKIYQERIDFGIKNSIDEGVQSISDVNIFSSLKHEIDNILKGPEGFLDLLPDFLINNNIDAETPLVPNQKVTFNDRYTRATKSINQVKNVLENIQSVLSSDKKQLKVARTNLVQFFNDCLKQESQNLNLDFYVLREDKKKKEKPIWADIDTQQFQILLRNMLANAYKHGQEAELIFVVNLKEQEDEIIIEFLNNGKELPSSFSLESFVAFGIKSGSSKGQGIGGFIINKIVKNHNGVLDIIEAGSSIEINDERSFRANVHFAITIPKTL